MLTFEKVLEIFADYLAADETTEVYISRHGCVRVEFDQDFHYCSGEVCHTPKELLDLLADDYRTYLEIELTKGRRELTEDDVKEVDALYGISSSRNCLPTSLPPRINGNRSDNYVKA